jgi:hypothetical protein
MEMFLMVFAIALLGVAVSAGMFAAATRGVDPVPEPVRRPAVAASAPRFFVDPPVVDAAVPIEVLLLQLEQHIRLEQAAAEAFLIAPTRQSLHSRTVSPLVH